MEKILITGTGRSGTTFLIKIFSFLDFDTGFNINNYKKYIHSNCNSGMENPYNAKPYILKSPGFMSDIEKIVKNKENITIKTVIIPIRDFKTSAKSRVKHGRRPGGLWGANDELSQINFYKNILTNYIYISTKYDINTIFVDFDRMINDKKYLFNKLKNILDEKNINFKTFSDAYDEASILH
tara:strand:- start:69 stop:614 length:546 start_codon:yes stop_codon:yes gene_type:complete